MHEPAAAECERAVTELLHATRAQYAHALEGTGEKSNVFRQLNTELYVDQIRAIAVSTAAPSQWILRNGRRCIETASIVGRSFLARFVGRARHLSADGFLRILTDMIAATPHVTAGETTVATFVNLVVVEPYHRPSAELPIWLTVAHNVARGRYTDDLHGRLSGLLTDHDVLSDELPPNALLADKLRPAVAHPPVESATQLGVRVLSAIRPDLAGVISALTTDDEQSALLHSLEPEMRAYIRTHVFERIADASRRGLRGCDLEFG